MSKETIDNITKSDSNFAPTFVDHNSLLDINFNGHCFINNIYIPKKVINIYISDTLNPWLGNLNTDFTLNNCLFGSVKLSKNADPDKYKYSGYGIRKRFVLSLQYNGSNSFLFFNVTKIYQFKAKDSELKD